MWERVTDAAADYQQFLEPSTAPGRWPAGRPRRSSFAVLILVRWAT